MYCFKVKKGNNEGLDKINRNFLWTPNIGSIETKVIPLVAWDDVCRPESEGGLGIGEMEM